MNEKPAMGPWRAAGVCLLSCLAGIVAMSLVDWLWAGTPAPPTAANSHTVQPGRHATRPAHDLIPDPHSS